MTKPKGYYTDKSGKVHPVFGKQPHVKTLAKGTGSLRIPKRTIQKQRVKGFSKLTRVTNQAQGTFAHSISHSPRYQKSVIERMGRVEGEKFLRQEHEFLADHYTKGPHKSPFKLRV